MTRRSSRPRAFAPDPAAPGRCCDMPGCDAVGEYRAPKSRQSLNEYWWFCLNHVREYNGAWDFYRGMSPGEIEAQVRADTSWQRPTWPLGQLGGRVDEVLLRKVAGGFRPEDLAAAQAGTGPHGAPGHEGVGAEARMGRREPAAPPELREPLRTLGLAWPVSLDVVKQRYKALAKQHHPDANGGDRAAEERLKIINLAYAAVRGRLARGPQPAAG